jgi:hypothetical protein
MQAEKGNGGSPGVGEPNAKSTTITVNGRTKEVAAKELSFAEVVALADGLPSGENITYTVTFRRGQGEKPEGTLVDGQMLKVKDGMIVSVTASDKS